MATQQLQDHKPISLALLKLLAQSSKCIREGRSKPVKTAFSDIRKRIKESTG